MAKRALRPCAEPGCNVLTRDKGGRCDKHLRKAWNDRGSATERGYGWSWKKLRDAIMVRDKHLCQNCYRQGLVARARHVDHIIPKSQGGTDEPENLEAICIPCHTEKTTRERHGK